MINQISENSVPVLSLQVEKDIVVIMPFGSGNEVTENRAILDLMRIKYLIENMINIKPRGSKNSEPIKYTVRPFRTMSGVIACSAAKAIAEADIVVALITEFNANVIYELAIRNLLKEEVVIICGDEVDKKKENLPIYTREFATISYRHHEDRDIINAIKSLSEMTGIELDWDKIDQENIPPALKTCIDKNDTRLYRDLQNAMQNLENGKASRPEFLQELSKDLDPGKMLSNWTSYCPFSILRILWKRKSGTTGYVLDDMTGEPVVVSANNKYQALFALNMQPFPPDPNDRQALTAGRLLNNVKPYIKEEHFEKFVQDQNRTNELIIYNDSIGTAKVPIQFTNDHPEEAFKGKVILPNLIAKRVVGEPHRPHVMYLLVTFIEDFFPID